MSDFYVAGRFVVPCEPKGYGQIINRRGLGQFWNEEVGTELQYARGCYVFAVGAGRGIIPLYVGQATKSFKQECFNVSNVGKVNSSLLHWKKLYKVSLFLVPLTPKPGPVNKLLVNTVEEFLIQNAVARNPNLANVKGTKQEVWGIKKIIRGGAGKRNAVESQFTKMMGL